MFLFVVDVFGISCCIWMWCRFLVSVFSMLFQFGENFVSSVIICNRWGLLLLVSVLSMVVIWVWLIVFSIVCIMFLCSVLLVQVMVWFSSDRLLCRLLLVVFVSWMIVFGFDLIFLVVRIWVICFWIWFLLSCLRLNCRQCDSIVIGSFCGLVVVSRNFMCFGGFFSVFSSVLNVVLDSMCILLIRQILYLLWDGMYWVFLIILWMLLILVLDVVLIFSRLMQ